MQMYEPDTAAWGLMRKLNNGKEWQNHLSDDALRKSLGVIPHCFCQKPAAMLKKQVTELTAGAPPLYTDVHLLM